jgi:urease beta subunit
MHMAARAGGTYSEVIAAGKASVAPEHLLDGVAALIGEIRAEVALEEGTRLMVLRGLGAPDAEAGIKPGATVIADGEIVLNEGLAAFGLEVVNDSDHAVRVSSHFPFERVNRRLRFDREAARGSRLDIPAGDTVRWAAGESRTVRLVRIRTSKSAT